MVNNLKLILSKIILDIKLIFVCFIIFELLWILFLIFL